MKTIFLILVFGIWSGTAMGSHGDLTEVKSDYLFVPHGFDDNDETEIVLDGFLPSYCYRLTQAGVEVDLSSRRIIVQQGARYFPAFCFDIPTPFTAVIKIGRLPEGSYEVLTRDGTLRETLSIKRSPFSEPDEYFFAPVEIVGVVHLGEGRHEAILEGRYFSKCFQLKETRVQNYGKVVEILPITGFRIGDRCLGKQNTFRVSVELPPLDPAYNRVLLHVRSLNGQSVNVVFSEPDGVSTDSQLS